MRFSNQLTLKNLEGKNQKKAILVICAANVLPKRWSLMITDIKLIFSCYECKQSFDFRVDLTVHTEKNHKISKKSESHFRCKICLKNFIDLKAHSKYHCEKCDSLLADESSLNAHIESCERKIVYFWKYRNGRVIKQLTQAF